MAWFGVVRKNENKTQVIWTVPKEREEKRIDR